MFALRSMLVLTVVSLGMFAASKVEAGPPLTHALIHIENTSTAKATVYYKWGSGAWKKTVIEKGTKHYFNYRYDGTSQKSPDFHVIIDVDTDGVKYVEHILTRGASPDDNSNRYGHHYAIKQIVGTDTRYIDAVSNNKATVRVVDKNAKAPKVN
jgi:hypothetical protein